MGKLANQVVGGINGTGNTAVEAGADVTANHIVQGALAIGGKVGSPGNATLQASDSQGRPLNPSLDEHARSPSRFE